MPVELQIALAIFSPVLILLGLVYRMGKTDQKVVGMITGSEERVTALVGTVQDQVKADVKDLSVHVEAVQERLSGTMDLMQLQLRNIGDRQSEINDSVRRVSRITDKHGRKIVELSTMWKLTHPELAKKVAEVEDD